MVRDFQNSHQKQIYLKSLKSFSSNKFREKLCPLETFAAYTLFVMVS